MRRLSSLKQAFASKEEFKAFVKTKDAPSEGVAYFNEDLLPTPPGNFLDIKFTAHC